MKNEEMKVTMITASELETVVGGTANGSGIFGIPRGGRINIRVKGNNPFCEEDDPTKAGIRVKVRV